jgi:hypothetical protein
LLRAFQAKGLSPIKFKFFVFSSKGAFLDVVIAVPEVSTGVIIKRSRTSQSGLFLRADAFSPQPLHAGAEYSSYQVGTLGRMPVYQVSFGTIFAINPASDRFYLPYSPENRTTARSSGSLIYILSTEKPTSWTVGGIVECAIAPTLSSAGVPISGAIRVISIQALLRASAREIAIGELVRTPFVIDKDCTPIDARYGGGL